jgi:hypothetical protein
MPNDQPQTTQCRRHPCGLDGRVIADFSGFNDSSCNGELFLRFECKNCGRRFIGRMVEEFKDE